MQIINIRSIIRVSFIGPLMLACVFALLLAACAQTAPAIQQLGRGPGPTGFMVKELVREQRHRNYVVFVPHAFVPQAGQRYPVIVYLHSLGEAGDDPRAMLWTGLAPYVAFHSRTFPFIAIFPQSSDGMWAPESENGLDVIAELDAITSSYPVDADRIYLMGVGTGGAGTWNIGGAHWERFAALVPIASTANGHQPARELIHAPIRAYRSVAGDVFGGTNDADAVDNINRLGGQAQYIQTPTYGADCWDYVFTESDLFSWLADQHRLPWKLGQLGVINHKIGGEIADFPIMYAIDGPVAIRPAAASATISK